MVAAMCQRIALSGIEAGQRGALHAGSAALLFSFALGDFVGIIVLTPLLIALRDKAGRVRESWAPLLADGLVLVPLGRARRGGAAAPSRAGVPAVPSPCFRCSGLAFRYGWRAGAVALSLLSAGVYAFDQSLFASLASGPAAGAGRGRGRRRIVAGRLQRHPAPQRRALSATVDMLSIAHPLADIANRLTSQQEDERRRIGIELHDQIGQDMTAIATRLRLVERTPRGSCLARRPGVDRALVADAHTHLREVIHDLHPAGWTASAWRAHWRKARSRSCSATTTSTIAAPSRATSTPCPDIATALYRICQEASTNCARHGCGGRVGIHLSLVPRDDHAELVLRIEDEAGPLEIDPEQRGRGLQGIRDRADAIGADYYFHPIDGYPRHWLQVRVPLTT